MKRPHVTSLRLDDDERARLERLAAEAGVTPSDLLRKLLWDAECRTLPPLNSLTLPHTTTSEQARDAGRQIAASLEGYLRGGGTIKLAA